MWVLLWTFLPFKRQQFARTFRRNTKNFPLTLPLKIEIHNAVSQLVTLIKPNTLWFHHLTPGFLDPPQESAEMEIVARFSITKFVFFVFNHVSYVSCQSPLFIVSMAALGNTNSTIFGTNEVGQPGISLRQCWPDNVYGMVFDPTCSDALVFLMLLLLLR